MRQLSFRKPGVLIPLVVLCGFIGFALTYAVVVLWTPSTDVPPDDQYTATAIVALDDSLFGKASYHIDYITEKKGRPEKHTVTVPFPVERVNAPAGVFQNTMIVTRGRVTLSVRPDDPLLPLPGLLQNAGELTTALIAAMIAYLIIYVVANIVNKSD